LLALPEQPAVIILDNASTDGTADAAEAVPLPEVTVVRLDRNSGAAARNLGVLMATTPYVAFSDDDSWWAPGALAQAADLFDRRAGLGLIAARVVVEPQGIDDPICAQMAASPLPALVDLPGPPVLGFLACGAVVRRDAFLAARGFPEAFGVGGEEAPLAIALAAHWELAYVRQIVAHHQPSPQRGPRQRARRQARNNIWTAWLRLPIPTAIRATVAAAARAGRDVDAWAGILVAVPTLPWVWQYRDIGPPSVVRRWRTLSNRHGTANQGD
jgi:glycosyltransferase involved in cell wall biosynthesis